MSLIPANLYYERDTSDQWQKKKQTAKERRAAKLAKLNPENQLSALDIMKEKERKRKRELEGEQDVDTNYQGDGMERPREGMKQKKRKLDEAGNAVSVDSKDQDDATEEDLTKKAKAEKRKVKEQRKKEKLARKEEKRKAKRAHRQAAKREEQREEAEQAPLEQSEQHDAPFSPIADDLEPFDASGLADEPPSRPALSLDTNATVDEQNHHTPISGSPSPPPDSTFSHASKISTSSASSAPSITAPSNPPFSNIHPPKSSSDKSTSDRLPGQPMPNTSDHTSDGNKAEKYAGESDPTERSPKSAPLTPEEKERFKQRLHDRIAELRAVRKADGPDGRPARNRQELIEARRQEQAKKKQRKKEQRRLSKEEEAREKAEAELALLRGSGSPIGSPGEVYSRKSSPDRGSLNFGFGRVAWGDGTHLDKAGSTLNPAHKRKGPSDPRTALEAAEKKKQRLDELDEGKRAGIEEKDAWLNANKRAHGERVKDDENLLKKALKRKDNKKQKSSKQWLDRLKAVERGKVMKQKKREENLRERKEQKQNTGQPKKKVKRPGFEGTFRGRHGKLKR